MESNKSSEKIAVFAKTGGRTVSRKEQNITTVSQRTTLSKGRNTLNSDTAMSRAKHVSTQM